MTLSAASPALEVDGGGRRGRVVARDAGLKGAKVAGAPSVRFSVAGTLPPTGGERVGIRGARRPRVFVRTEKMSVWSIVPWMSAARGPDAQTGTAAPV